MAKRKRLSKKQLWFLINVFEADQPVTVALQNLNIRPTTLNRWLTKPVFVERLRLHINHFYLEARLELARTTPGAISGLSFLTEKSLRHGEVRHACNDLLNFHAKLAKSSQNSNPKQQSALEGFSYVPEGTNFGSLLENFGVISDNNGTVSDKLGSTNKPQNLTYSNENAENEKNM